MLTMRSHFLGHAKDNRMSGDLIAPNVEAIVEIMLCVSKLYLYSLLMVSETLKRVNEHFEQNCLL
jgi:hypothetical protein